MKTNINIKRVISILLMFPFLATSLSFNITSASVSNDKIVYPLQEVSKLSCRYQDFKDLGSNCKQKLPILNTKDYKKYIKQNGGYNEFTRYYTVLWGASYKYGWDVGFGGHQGTDISTSKGTPVYSMSNGKVIVAKRAIGWGSVISIEHTIRGKKVFSNYAHLSKIGVKKGQIVKAGEKIGEVGSEGNSTGNHLHFQIDLDTPFHPYYYDKNSCPYSYSKITEEGVCFNELSINTIDPLVFLETKGAVLDKLKTTNIKISRDDFNTTPVKTKTSNKNTSVKSLSNDDFINIFNKTVYIGYSNNDIKDVQKVFKTLGYYKGLIDGDYSKLEKNVIEYQLKRGIINSKYDNGSGRFGPKTRAQAKTDYLKIVGNIGQRKTTFKKVNSITNTNRIVNESSIKTEKIERRNILTRAEIEKKEIDDFLRYNNINLSLSNIGGNIKLGSNINLNIEIKDKKKGRYFRGNTPLHITFPVNNSNIKVFPAKLYNFSDGKRTARITGVKEGSSVLQVKLGNKILKTFNIKVVKSGKIIYPKSAKILGSSKIIFGETKKGLVLMRDENNKNLINLRYGSTFTLKTNGDAKVCVKKGSIKDIKKIFKSNCKDADFKESITLDYNSTVGGLIIFDYKASGKNPKIELLNNYKNVKLAIKNLYVSNPKDIKKSYVYHDDVVSMLEKNIATGINKGYFLQGRDLTNGDALKWIENTLIKLNENTVDLSSKSRIEGNLKKIKLERLSKYKAINRRGFLELSYKYLIFNNSKGYTTKNYRDIDSNLNKMAGTIFGENITWKDSFGDKYFRPDTHIKRGEAAFMLNQVYKNNKKYFLTLR